jgi:nitrite reductase/ring-hydroxylating ferredoxin subunit
MMAKSNDGRGYGRPAPTYSADLTEVGPGKPMGELMRRYWHPIGLIQDATDVPRLIRILGEDLILFRDKKGRPGLVEPRCCHRGASLYYGRVEDEGIRCAYHGWLFDVEGRCLDMQMSREDGASVRGKVRQPWYPVKEQYGLIWAYVGPGERQPVLPKYACLEELAEGEWVEADDSSIGGGGPPIAPCNWLQHYENVLDPDHFQVLHFTHSGPQFGVVRDPGQRQAILQRSFSQTPYGVKNASRALLPNGRATESVTEVVFPTLRVVGGLPRGTENIATDPEGFRPVESIGWVLPIDDTHYRIYVAGRVTRKGQLGELRSKFNGKYWWEMTEDEHQRFPGDYEIQVSQGPIAYHSDEHLVPGDQGVGMIRRGLRMQLKEVSEGRDPIGVNFDENAPPIRLEGGRTLGPIPQLP